MEISPELALYGIAMSFISMLLLAGVLVTGFIVDRRAKRRPR